jgi:hypothetical protein
MTITLDQTPSTGPGQSPDDQMQQLFDQAYGYGATALDLAGKLDPETLDPTVWDLANTAVQYRDRIADLATRVKDAPVDDEESPGVGQGGARLQQGGRALRGAARGARRGRRVTNTAPGGDGPAWSRSPGSTGLRPHTRRTEHHPGPRSPRRRTHQPGPDGRTADHRARLPPRPATRWPTLHGYVVTYAVDSLPNLSPDGQLHAAVAALDEAAAAQAVHTGVAKALGSLLDADTAQRHLATLRILGVSPTAPGPAGTDSTDTKAPGMTDNGIHFDEYDLLELVAFHGKADTEGFTYTFENYPPRFGSESLQRIAADMGDFRRLFTEHDHLVDQWWETHEDDGGELLDAHLDAQRNRPTEP